MRRALEIRLFALYHADIIEEFSPETGIKQVQRDMLHAAVIPVYGHPVVERLA